jgi:hypothetical protein
MDFKNYLIATIQVPVKFNIDGEFIMLDNYANIRIEPMTEDPKETFDSISEKLIEYIHKNPSYLSSIVAEQNKSENVENNYEYNYADFAGFKRSKKPLNTSFRNKGAKHNFTKKNYEG